MSVEQKEKIRQKLLGRKITWNDKISKSCKGRSVWNKGKKGLQTSWLKGKTKHTDDRILKYFSVGRKLNKNPAWRGGTSFEPYSEEFTRKLKSKIKKRDNFTCQLCEMHKCKLHIHHIDYDKKNCNPTNLISLCVSCHSKTNFNRAHWTKLLGGG